MIKIYIISCVQRPERSVSEVQSRLVKPRTFLKCFLSEELIRESMMILIEVIFGH